ncbi:MAG: hypothetical protein KAX49_19915 [Halanaerobiales bacterium]|nr:hypothetical protein [Halanaerobiales bacterium]
MVFPENISIELDLDQLNVNDLLIYLVNYIQMFISEETSRKRYVQDDVEDIETFIKLFNNDIAKIKSKYKNITFILDDFEKIPFKCFTDFILEFVPISRTIEANFIMSVKLQTFFDDSLLDIREKNISKHYIIPAVHIVDRNGERNIENILFLKEIIKRRLGEFEIEEHFLDQIVKYSGGVTRVLINLVRGILVSAFTNGRDYVNSQDVRESFNDYYNEYQRRIYSDDIKELKMINRDKRIDPSNAHFLDKLIVLEYADQKRWYEVHPIVNSILEENKSKLENILLGDSQDED